MDNFNKSYDTSTGTTKTILGGGTYTYSGSSCAHCLPCGYCPLLSRFCPMQYQTTLTCATAEATDAD